MKQHIRCPDCAEEYLLAFSCKTRELCPSCAANRSAATAALLAEDVLEEVAHAQWVFVIPKMLRPCTSCTTASFSEPSFVRVGKRCSS